MNNITSIDKTLKDHEKISSGYDEISDEHNQ
jgi:hypothetical protein